MSQGPFKRGQRKLSARHLNDIQEVAERTRRGNEIEADGARIVRGANGLGNKNTIEVLPILYKVVARGSVAPESSSSSTTGSGTSPTINVTGKQVDASDGSTHGPLLTFVTIESS